jgi:hypothetical protein
MIRSGSILVTSILISAAAYAQGKPAQKEAPAPTALASATSPTPAAAPAPTLSPEGKRWVEGMLGWWRSNDAAMQMGDQKMKGKMTMACEKTSGGWAAICKGKFTAKGMPTQEMTVLMGWDSAAETAHMFEVANTGETHNHTGKWTDDKTISVVHSGKNLQGKEEVDTLTFNWVSPKEVKVSGDGKQGTTTAWSFVSTMKK